MDTPSAVVSWSPGDFAVIADGEYGGMHAKVWTVNLAEGKAVISLRVFSENTPFEIELSQLLKPIPLSHRILKATKYALLRAIGYGLATLLAGPLSFWFFCTLADSMADWPRIAFLSWNELGSVGLIGLLITNRIA